MSKIIEFYDTFLKPIPCLGISSKGDLKYRELSEFSNSLITGGTGCGVNSFFNWINYQIYKNYDSVCIHSIDTVQIHLQPERSHFYHLNYRRSFKFFKKKYNKQYKPDKKNIVFITDIAHFLLDEKGQEFLHDLKNHRYFSDTLFFFHTQCSSLEKVYPLLRSIIRDIYCFKTYQSYPVETVHNPAYPGRFKLYENEIFVEEFQSFYFDGLIT